jgi:hypothetical protein
MAEAHTQPALAPQVSSARWVTTKLTALLDGPARFAAPTFNTFGILCLAIVDLYVDLYVLSCVAHFASFFSKIAKIDLCLQALENFISRCFINKIVSSKASNNS